jgi:hypothetical protein
MKHKREPLKNHFKDRIETSNCRIYVHTTQSVKTKLHDTWPTRSYPDPKDNNRELVFRSENEYLEFIIRALNDAPDGIWNLFKHILNPDYGVRSS